MDIGIGIPNTVGGTSGDELLDWARRADEAGFSSLASIGAVSYPGYEELTVFAAAAAVTDRIRFFPNVLIAPTRSAAELAKQAITVDHVSAGRLTLGLAVGWRDADYRLTGRDYDERGARFDEQLADLHTAWRGEPLREDTRAVGPRPVQSPGIPIQIGGTSDAAIRRVVEHGEGWTAGGMPPDAVEDMAGRVRSAWREAGRDGEPRITALAYFGLGDVERSREYILDYYAPAGSDTAAMIADNIMHDPDQIRGAVGAFEAAGVDEFILDPTIGDPAEVDRLAEAVL